MYAVKIPTGTFRETVTSAKIPGSCWSSDQMSRILLCNFSPSYDNLWTQVLFGPKFWGLKFDALLQPAIRSVDLDVAITYQYKFCSFYVYGIMIMIRGAFPLCSVFVIINQLAKTPENFNKKSVVFQDFKIMSLLVAVWQYPIRLVTDLGWNLAECRSTNNK